MTPLVVFLVPAHSLGVSFHKYSDIVKFTTKCKFAYRDVGTYILFTCNVILYIYAKQLIQKLVCKTIATSLKVTPHYWKLNLIISFEAAYQQIVRPAHRYLLWGPTPDADSKSNASRSVGSSYQLNGKCTRTLAVSDELILLLLNRSRRRDTSAPSDML